MQTPQVGDGRTKTPESWREAFEPADEEGGRLGPGLVSAGREIA